MSIAITTDIFCDGYDCGDWVGGVVGPRTNKTGALKEAKRHGWKITSRHHLCPKCRALTNEPKP